MKIHISCYFPFPNHQIELSSNWMGGQWWIRTTEVERQRIYSPPHLATLVTALLNKELFLSRKLESNQRPTDYKSVALPTELFRLVISKNNFIDLSRLYRDLDFLYFLSSIWKSTTNWAISAYYNFDFLKELLLLSQAQWYTLFFGKAKVREFD